jgi:hypothetical protein
MGSDGQSSGYIQITQAGLMNDINGSNKPQKKKMQHLQPSQNQMKKTA